MNILNILHPYLWSVKSEMPGIMCQLFSHWRALGKKVEIVRCDNATENKKFEMLAKEKGYQLGITMEYI